MLLLTLPLTVPSALASTSIPQPDGDIENVRLVGNIPTDTDATAINFLEYGQGHHQRDVMVTVGRFGVRAYDLADPTSPAFLSEVTSDELRLPGDVTGTFWQNEDMAVDERRKLVFLARDPRAYGGTTTDPDDPAGVYIVDASDPDEMFLRTFVEVGAGHTATCINSCDFLWVGGPASNTEQAAEWPQGRPILVVDVRDPDDPVVMPDPVDLHRNDGTTAYAHDVQVDAAGIAWVSGLGGVRGYHTDGVHWDPVDEVRRRATPSDPVPFAGGQFAEEGAPTAFMHNSLRAVQATAEDGPRSKHGHRADELIMATEEQFSQTDCSSQGMFSIASLRGSYDGEGWRSTPEEPFRLEVVGTWSPFEQEGFVDNPLFCSAHYFQMQGRVLTYSWYSQGTRFLDISDPTNPIQIAYYRPDVTNSWASYFHGDHIYVADHARGIDILELTVDARRAAEARTEVVAPPMSATQVENSRALAAEYAPDPQLGWACPVPRD
ncbi:LVIVD repeat-containing protein [Nitriliruptor alkaliphilus]|uniref:LVIVD repeat-containing protein n=1 Tax=Nitriliruptor alkaliphilus TaxID=427918 RepID=UPI001B7FF658|nr:hypothetical protein [Nitriliruptor alkaliphilus]